MAHPADVAVGKRLRLRRKELALTQADLARDLKITVQQLRRYETGADRMRASDLFHAAKHLEVSVRYFFRDLTADRPEGSGEGDFDLIRQSLQLLKLFSQIPDAHLRAQLIQLARHTRSEARPDHPA